MDYKETEMTENVKDIQISERTAALLRCHAQLSDIYNTMADIIYDKYTADTKDLFPDFDEAYLKFDKALSTALGSLLVARMVESKYKEL